VNILSKIRENCKNKKRLSEILGNFLFKKYLDFLIIAKKLFLIRKNKK